MQNFNDFPESDTPDLALRAREKEPGGRGRKKEKGRKGEQEEKGKGRRMGIAYPLVSAQKLHCNSAEKQASSL